MIHFRHAFERADRADLEVLDTGFEPTTVRIGGLDQLGEPAADLCRRRVGQHRSVAEDDRRYGEMAVIDSSDDRSAIGMIFNVDLTEVDSGAREL